MLGVTVAGTVKNYVPVTDEMLRNQDPGDWLMARRNYQGWSHSPLTQITRDNAKDLQLVWTWAMNEGQGNEPSPLVHNGVLYIVNIMNVVQALDARTGDLIWENRVGPNALIGQAAMRNMAIYQDKLFVATTDARLVALDARNGTKLWDTPIADRAKGYANTAGPMVMKGVVVNGLVGCDRYGNDGCWISGYDSSTGKQLWKFNTVRRGTEQGAETWGKLADNLRIGGETWISGSYDPDLDLTYWGVAQAKPWMRASARDVEFRQRAVSRAPRWRCDPKDGTLAWHYQHAPGESLDLDEVFERVLVDIGDQKVVFTIGKPGILWKLDRRNGAFLGYKETIFQNVFESIDREDRGTAVSPRHPRAADGTVGGFVSEHGRRTQLAGDELRAAGRDPGHSAQSVVHADERPQARVHEWIGRHRRRSPLLRDARHRRQRRQARRLRREDDEGGLESRAAVAVSHRRDHD